MDNGILQGSNYRNYELIIPHAIMAIIMPMMPYTSQV